MVEASIYTRVHRGSCLGDERHPLTYVGLGRFQHGMVSVSRDTTALPPGSDSLADCLDDQWAGKIHLSKT